MIRSLIFAVGTICFSILISVSSAFSKVEGDTIILGSSISLTGKYATNGLHTQRGYDYAVDVINSKGGVKVGGKSYKCSTIRCITDEKKAAILNSNNKKFFSDFFPPYSKK